MPQRITRARVPALGLALVSGALVLAGGAAAASPVQGSVAGPVTSVKGQTFSVKTSLSPTGSSKVAVGSKTTITEEVTVKQSDLKKGVCVMAFGTKKGSVVVASRITISRPVKGRCGGGFGGRPRQGGGQRPGGGTLPPRGSRPPGLNPPGNFGFASGGVSAIKGSTLTVHGQNGSTTVTVSTKTQISKTIQVSAKAITVKLCAFVRGASSDKGVTVQAENVALSKPGPNGCTSGFRRPS